MVGINVRIFQVRYREREGGREGGGEGGHEPMFWGLASEETKNFFRFWFLSE